MWDRPEDGYQETIPQAGFTDSAISTLELCSILFLVAVAGERSEAIGKFTYRAVCKLRGIDMEEKLELEPSGPD